ncbi:MAG: prolyl aminopeptidase [Bacteriovoracia bacterium]
MLKQDPVSWLYPETAPYRTGRLAVGDGHEIYYEECGNPAGKPAVFLHGGPGSGIFPRHRRVFDPERYRIVLFDQRGCGQSTPRGSIEHNTTWHLVSDIEKLREHLGIERWLVFGGSWGSTLALAYAQTHPSSVTEMVMLGIFLLRKREIAWFYQDGASFLFPDAYEEYVKPIPPAERGDLLAAFHRRLGSADARERMEAAKAWTLWEGKTITLLPNPDLVKAFSADEFAATFARMETHYFMNQGFFESEDQLLRGVDKIRHVPATIIHGRYDACCPLETAWLLHKAWPEADFTIVPDAGHAFADAANARAVIKATDLYARLWRKIDK